MILPIFLSLLIGLADDCTKCPDPQTPPALEGLISEDCPEGWFGYTLIGTFTTHEGICWCMYWDPTPPPGHRVDILCENIGVPLRALSMILWD